MSSLTRNMTGLLPAWEGLRKSVPHFGPIRNKRDYERMNSLMEYLLREVGEDEDHRLADLLDVVSTFVGEYEDRISTARCFIDHGLAFARRDLYPVSTGRVCLNCCGNSLPPTEVPGTPLSRYF